MADTQEFILDVEIEKIKEENEKIVGDGLALIENLSKKNKFMYKNMCDGPINKIVRDNITQNLSQIRDIEYNIRSRIEIDFVLLKQEMEDIISEMKGNIRIIFSYKSGNNFYMRYLDQLIKKKGFILTWNGCSYTLLNRDKNVAIQQVTNDIKKILAPNTPTYSPQNDLLKIISREEIVEALKKQGIVLEQHMKYWDTYNIFLEKKTPEVFDGEVVEKKTPEVFDDKVVENDA